MKNRMHGFGLIEILIAVFIVSFGVLAVGKLQTELFSSSSENKARQEALSLARQRLEDYRMYTNSLVTEASFASTDYFNGVQLALNGDYAVFTRSETYSFNGNQALVAVKVQWSDSKGDLQTVQLSTTMTYVNPILGVTGAYDVGLDSYVDAPTGRAYIGEGEVSTKGLTDVDRYQAEGDDGTSRYDDPKTDDRYLAVGDDVVLTLEDACALSVESETTVECTDFVEISGRVLFKKSNVTESREASDIFVLASDAAFCARYSGSGESVKQFEAGDTAVVSSLPQTSDGNYRYFNYTCYIGGGWHGNIGIVGTDDKSDHICVGDPDDEFNTPQETRRRAYRGMAWKYKTNSDGTADRDSEGRLQKIKFTATDQVIVDRNLTDLVGETRFYSWGIADASVLQNGSVNHDFLIVESNNSISCSNYMDSSNFSNNIDDFYCLNETVTGAKGIAFNLSKTEFEPTPTILNPRSNLDERPIDPDRDGDYFEPDVADTYGTSEEKDPHYGFDASCPYDPTNPPNYVHQISGSIKIVGDKSGNNSSTLFTGLKVSTSDGDNCTFTGGFNHTAGASDAESFYIGEYSCDVYDIGKKSGNSLVPAGWTGSITLNDINAGDSTVVDCPTSLSYSETLGDNSADIDCTVDINIVQMSPLEDSLDIWNDEPGYNLREFLLSNDGWPSVYNISDIDISFFSRSADGSYLELTNDGSHPLNPDGELLPQNAVFADGSSVSVNNYYYKLNATDYSGPINYAALTINVFNREVNNPVSYDNRDRLFGVKEQIITEIPFSSLLEGVSGDGQLTVTEASTSIGDLLLNETSISYTSVDVDEPTKVSFSYTVRDSNGDTASVNAEFYVYPKITILFEKENGTDLRSVAFSKAADELDVDGGGFSWDVYDNGDGFTFTYTASVKGTGNSDKVCSAVTDTTYSDKTITISKTCI